MNSTRKTLTGESGSTLVVVMICAMVMLITALALIELGAQDAALALRDVRVSQAFYNAEAGAERGEAWLGDQSNMPTTTTMPFSSSPESFGGGWRPIWELMTNSSRASPTPSLGI